MTRSTRAAAFVALASIAAACGGSPTPAEAPAKPPAPSPASKATTTSAGLTRSAVNRAIDGGLGALLRNVAVEDYPVMKDGKFHGFRIRAINPDWKVDLRPGDVVTRVNGMAIERPEQADAALRSLAEAPALRVDYERDGEARVLELPIVNDAASSDAQGKRAR